MSDENDNSEISLIDDSESISSEVLSLDDGAHSKLFGFNIPNCFSISTLFFYGLSNLENGLLVQAMLEPIINSEEKHFKNCNQHIIKQSNFSSDNYLKIRPSLHRELLPNKQTSKNYNYLYDRNPFIILNLISICKFIYYEAITDYINMDNLNSKDIEQSILKELRKKLSYQNVCFYSNSIINSPNIPLHCYSLNFKRANKKFFHSLQMAIGIENDICCLRLFSLKKSYHFCNGNMTEDDVSDNLSGFSPFFLLYKPCFLKEKANIYNHNSYKGQFKPSTPTFPSEKDRLKIFLSDLREKRWEKKEYTFLQYLIECLKFPAAFVAGTNYQDERYPYYLTVFFTNEVTTKENILKNVEDEEFKKGCRRLFNFYQKFLTFLRYICSSIEFFIDGDSMRFSETMTNLFSTLPTINPSIASPFIDFIKLLVKKFETTDKEYKELENALKKILDCTIDDGTSLTQHLKSVFNFGEPFPSQPITVYQSYKSLCENFKKLEDHLKNDLENIRKVKILSNHDDSNDYKFYTMFTDSISDTYFTRNDIII